MDKYVYSFNEGSRQMKSLLGIKGANLAEMTRIGLPVPFGFTITTEACRRFYEEKCSLAAEIADEICGKIEELENVTGRAFGSEENPLLISVRSGAPASMPGMLDTVLNLGLNDKTVEGLAAASGNRRFALDCYRRFIQMFASVVYEIPRGEFEQVFENKKEEVGAVSDVELAEGDLEKIISDYKEMVSFAAGRSFPQDPQIQLSEAVQAIFMSWNNERAKLYRKLNNIDENLGTAVNVQAMVFGNLGENSGTGVAFTRNPSTGEKKLFGEFLANAQGEDVVAGARTPLSLDSMAENFPDAYRGLERIAQLLEKHLKDVQDIEFTIENNKLYMLQTRDGKRTAQAAVQIAVDMVDEGFIDKKTALLRVEPKQISHMLHPDFNQEDISRISPAARGLAASPGAASGKIYFTAEEAILAAEKGEDVILVREETSPEDLAGMVAAKGFLTERGGTTSHAAIVARGMGKCCVAGCGEIDVDEEEKELTLADGRVLREGDIISIDGSRGLVYEGSLRMESPVVTEALSRLLSWADEVRELKIRVNADNAEEALQAVGFGAEGIGLCRTEHMFFGSERLAAIRRVIMADEAEEKKAALDIIKPFQQEDFKKIFKIMGERPVTIRLLDPPLHEFLPSNREEFSQLAVMMGIPPKKVRAKIKALREINPMMGQRGCRLIVMTPEIAVMQTEAVINAAIEVMKEENINIVPEIMIPLVISAKELAAVKKIVVETADRCIAEAGVEMKYLVGTMIETPRSALTADELAEEAEFFSFGTNDLTQMVFGLSREDVGKVVREYVKQGIMDEDPFRSIDMKGVGKLIGMAVSLGRQTKPKLRLGICGEHAGNQETVELCHNLRLNYVSCSPFRVHAARLAAAQAAVRNQEE